MFRTASVMTVLALSSLLLFADRVSAQGTGAIAGLVKDSSGAVLPGVTVEASSPALIEKVRTVVTDGQGQYRIADLVPGAYTLVFSLTGFSSVRHEGLQLSSGFTATINADMRVGSLEETITVSGQSPLVDVQTTTAQKTLSHDLLESLPTNKGIASFAALTPGVSLGATAQDVGGNKGELATMSIHGGAGNDQRLLQDGMRFNSMEGSGRGFYVNPAAAEEITLALGGNPVENELGGVQVNVVPREGGNIFHGYFFGNYASTGLQSDNLTDELRARGLTTANKIDHIWDVNGAYGGPIRKDNLWFYSAHRSFGYADFVAGGYYNATQGTPFYTADLSRTSVVDEKNRSHTLRLTWQASRRNKFNFSVDVENNCDCHVGLTSSTSPEAAIRWFFANPNYLTQASWNHPVSSKLLIEAGVTTLIFNFPTVPQEGVKPSDVSISDSLLGIRYNSLAIGTYEYGFKYSSQSNQKLNLSYITGSHAFKVGLFTLEGWRDHKNYVNGDVNYTFRNKIPSSLTEAIPYEAKERLGLDLGLYAQDVWTMGRLTLNLGLRFDSLNAFDPAQTLDANIYTTRHDYGRVDCVPCWKDISPRFGGSWDPFGDSKTAIKASVGKFVTAESVNNLAFLNNPIVTSILTATRTWGDTNNNLVPDCNLSNPLENGECKQIDRLSFGSGNPAATTYAPDVLKDNRGHNWQITTNVQRELRSGLSANFGYYRTWYSNLMATDNTLAAPADYSPYSIVAPSNPALPDGGGYVISGLYDISQAKFGQVQNNVTLASNFGTRIQRYDGFDMTMTARVSRGIFLGGGVNMGRTITDTCYVVDSPGELRFCHVAPPFQPQIKFSGSYNLPFALQASGTYQDLPGIAESATYAATNAEIKDSLGRNLASGGTASVSLIAPNAVFEPRIRQLDLRLSRTFRKERRNIQAIVDLYNALNGSAVLSEVTTYGPRWRTPTEILAGRFFKFGIQANF
jgi:Carboxypeptidase regulatory-like domain/TonB-dependent Receptor Plug Domain